VCAATTCNPHTLSQALVAFSLPFLIGLTLFRSWLHVFTERYLPSFFNTELF
jgi:hypothetical protein